MRINTNILSLNAQRNLANTSRALSRAMQRLASGQRVNTARDDAAGLAIGNGLESQRRGMIQASRNINDARGFLNTAEGAMATQAELVQRMRELAVQASNGTLSDESRGYLNSEVQELLEEFSRITNQTQFNGVNLLDGSFEAQVIQVGVNKAQTVPISLANMRASQVFLETTTTSETIGTGTYQAGTSLTTGSAPREATAADLNGDGLLDLIAGDAAGHTVSIQLGNGNGTFQARTTLEATGTSPYAVRATDINGDGKLDLVASSMTNNLSLYLGNGDGTFQTRTTISAALSFPVDVEAADLNGDGNIDLINVDYLGAQMVVHMGNGNGTFQTRVTYAAGPAWPNSLQHLLPSDVNGDGNMDVITVAAGEGVSVFLGNGNGTFQTRVTYAGNSTDVRTGDINGDGKLDLIVSDSSTATTSLYLGNGNGTFQSRTTIPAGSGPYFVAVEDVNGDGNLDILTADFGANTVSISLGNGNGTFQTRTTIAVGANPISVLLADFDGDGVNDLTVGYTGTSYLSLFLANSTDLEDSSTDSAQVSLSTQTSAENMLEVFDTALAYINSARSTIGAQQSRLDFTESVSQTLVENLSAAKSQLMDADYSIETADFSRLQILQQAGVAVLGQANINAKLALKLLERI